MFGRATPWSWSSLVLVLVLADSAQAQDTVDGIRDPRSVGRAGTSMVSGDSGMTLLTNPGGMVRRAGKRLLLSASLADNDTTYAAANAPDAPVLLNRAAANKTPLIAYHQGNEAGSWVLGALLMGGNAIMSLPTPTIGQPKDDVTRLFPHRYGGTQWERRWRRFTVGGAVRLGESVGIGLSASLSQVQLRESKRIWAGFAGRDDLLDPELDLAIQLSGKDLYNPGSTLGVLLAPPELPLEFALAFEFRRGQHFRNGLVSFANTTNSQFPQPNLNNASASLRLPDHYDTRAGIRYLGESIFVEVGAEFFYLRNERARSWSLEGVSVIDSSRLDQPFLSMGAMVSERSHLALRGAIDYEAIAGYLWVTGGYAYQSPSQSKSRANPGYARLGGHTLAVGLEATYEDFIVSLGYAHHLERSRLVSDEISAMPVENPFDAGTTSANSGRYRQSSDQLGFAIEVSFR